MDELTVPFLSQEYLLAAGLLAFARGMDFLSTWLATPNLIHEGNPIARKLGWRWGGAVNVIFCCLVAFLPLSAIVVATTSLLVAARNFKSAWVMHALGEDRYQLFMSDVTDQSSRRVYFICLLGETGLTALLGAAVMVFSFPLLIPIAIGWGIVGYGAAVALYSLISMWRMRHRMR